MQHDEPTLEALPRDISSIFKRRLAQQRPIKHSFSAEKEAPSIRFLISQKDENQRSLLAAFEIAVCDCGVQKLSRRTLSSLAESYVTWFPRILFDFMFHFVRFDGFSKKTQLSDWRVHTNSNKKKENRRFFRSCGKKFAFSQDSRHFFSSAAICYVNDRKFHQNFWKGNITREKVCVWELVKVFISNSFGVSHARMVTRRLPKFFKRDDDIGVVSGSIIKKRKRKRNYGINKRKWAYIMQ